MALGKDTKIKFIKDRPGHDVRYALNSNKIKEEIKWKSKIKIEKGLEETFKWYLDNKEWMDRVTSGDYKEYYKKMYKQN